VFYDMCVEIYASRWILRLRKKEERYSPATDVPRLTCFDLTHVCLDILVAIHLEIYIGTSTHIFLCRYVYCRQTGFLSFFLEF